MNNQKRVDVLDYVFSVVVIVAVIASIFNAVSTLRAWSAIEQNTAHICGLTNMLFGPVDPTQYKELCDLLRADLYNEWQR